MTQWYNFQELCAVLAHFNQVNEKKTKQKQNNFECVGLFVSK